jgi:hypothetical protein
MNTPNNPILIAAAPALLAVVAAIETLIDNVGSDPAQVAVKWPGALQVFLGTIEMQLPVLAVGELGAVQVAAKARLAGVTTQLKALLAPPPP